MFISEFQERKEVIDLSRPSVRGLAYLLRHSELWPKGFEFNYLSQVTCAIGLAATYWHLRDFTSVCTTEALGLSNGAARAIFMSRSSSGFRGHSPLDIAETLDQYSVSPTAFEKQYGARFEWH